jgi:hypothetical protein
MKPLIRQAYLQNFKSVYTWIFLVLLPIIWVFLYGYGISLAVKGVAASYAVTSLVPMLLLLSSMSTGFMTLAINISQLKQTKQFKQISLANITTSQYIFAQYLVNLTFVVSITLIQALLLGTIFKIHFNFEIIIIFCLVPLFSFSLGIMLGLLIGSIGNSQRTAQFIIMIFFYLIMFTSGFFRMWEPYSIISQTLPMITPWGCMNVLMQYTVGINAPGISQIWWSIPIGIVEIVAITICTFKFFKWV